MRLLRYFKNLIEINPGVSFVFDRLASTPIYQKIIKNKINKTIFNLKKNKNYNIIIETTNFCNAQCVMCPHTIMKRSQKIMDETIFNKIINRIKQENIHPNAFILNGFGEPLVDLYIINRIKTIKSIFPQSKIKFYSNLNLANQKLIKKIVSSGLNEINISFNGYNRQNYQKVMKINYLKTLKNLKFLIKTKQDTFSPLKIRISMTLVKYNEKSAQKFIQKWSHLVDSVSVNKVHDYHHSVKNITNKFKINFQKPAFPCKYIWDTIPIDVDGNVTLCCLDYESQYKFGNIKTQPILKSFYSPQFNTIRQQHLNNNISQINMCRTCYTPYKNGVEWLIDKLL